MPGALSHAHSLFQATIGQHATMAAVAMGALIVVILVLLWELSKAKTALAAATKSSFVRTPNNLTTGGNNPLWWHGSGDAGHGGTLHRDATAIHAAAFAPGAAPSCGGTWDPAASAEVKALASVGSLQHDSYGEKKLQSVINSAYDGSSAAGLSDSHLSTIMHDGGM